MSQAMNRLISTGLTRGPHQSYPGVSGGGRTDDVVVVGSVSEHRRKLPRTGDAYWSLGHLHAHHLSRRKKPGPDMLISILMVVLVATFIASLVLQNGRRGPTHGWASPRRAIC
jgi:hypothetical protein